MLTAYIYRKFSQNGNLVKRPFVLGKDIALVGFKPETWLKSLL